MFDLVISGGTVVTSKNAFSADIGVKDGKIAAIGEVGTLKGQNVDNAAGKLIMPGFMEPHMHVKAPFTGGMIDVLDFACAGRAAAHGGITSFMDFSTTTKDTPVADAVPARLAEMGEGALDFSVHPKFINADAASLQAVRDLSNGETPLTTFKMFTIYDGVKIGYEEIKSVMKAAKEVGAVCGFHAEDEELAKEYTSRIVSEGRTAITDFPDHKPNMVEAEAVKRLLDYAEELDAKIYFYHISAKESVDLIRAAKKRGVRVHAETCGHYLTLTKEHIFERRDLMENDQRPDPIMCLMSPPLRSEEDRAALWNGLKDGTLDLVTSDNEAFWRSQKDEQVKKADAVGDPRPRFQVPVNGTPGIEERFGLLMNAVNNGVISMNEMVRLGSANPAIIFGCYPKKGCIRVGSDADLVIVDPQMHKSLMGENLDYYGFSKPSTVESNQGELVHYTDTIFGEFSCKGWPVSTIRRGEYLVKDGRWVGDGLKGTVLGQFPSDAYGTNNMLVYLDAEGPEK